MKKEKYSYTWMVDQMIGRSLLMITSISLGLNKATQNNAEL